VFKSNVIYGLSPVLGVKFVTRLFKVLKFAIKALSALGNEMFRLTNATRGGMLLMMVFFYSAFVLGTSLWIQTNGENEACTSFQSCSYTLMRLTFYDGTGFDFAYSLTGKHRFLFFLVIVYMCLTSFGLLNGLVGIFGTAFAVASDDAFNDSDEEDEDTEEAHIENGEDGDGDEPQGGNSSWARSYKRSKSGKFGDGYSGDSHGSGDAGTNLYGHDEDADSDGEEVVERVAFPVFQRGMSRKKLETKQLETQLKGKLGGKSNFALKELQKMADAEVQAQKAPRRTLRDIIHANSGSLKATAGGQTGMSALAGAAAALSGGAKPNSTHPADSGGSGQESPERERMQKPVALPFGAKKVNKNLHAAVGMFSTLKNQKSGKNLLAGANSSASAGHSAHGGSHNAHSTSPNPFKQFLAAQKLVAATAGAPSAASAAELSAMSANLQTLQRTVEAQQQMMLCLLEQIQVLNTSLHILHPDLPEAPAVVVPVLPVLEPVAPAQPATTHGASLAAMLPRRPLMGFNLGHKGTDHSGSATPGAPQSPPAPTGSSGSPRGAHESHNSSTSSLPPGSGVPPSAGSHRKPSILSHLHFNQPGHGGSRPEAAQHVPHDEQPANPALRAVHHDAAIEPRTSKERHPMLAAFLHGPHSTPKQPQLDGHAGHATHVDEQAVVVDGGRSQRHDADAVVMVSATASLAAVPPSPVVSLSDPPIAAEQTDAVPSASSGDAEGKAAITQSPTASPATVRALEPRGISQGSVDSFGSMEVIEMNDDGEGDPSLRLEDSSPTQRQEHSPHTLPSFGPSSSVGFSGRPGAQSKPRKSPIPGIRHHHSSQSSVLGAMGRFTSSKVSIFDDPPQGDAREFPLPAHLPPVSTTLAVKPQDAQLARPQTRKSSGEVLTAAAVRNGRQLDVFTVSERTEYEGGADDVREIDPVNGLSALDV
jgi:hypothetical protein